MPEKYLYKDKVLQRKDVEDAAKQSGMDIDTYSQKAGLKRVNDNYNYNGKTISAEDVFDAAKQSGIGFDDYIQKAKISPIEDVKKKEFGNISGTSSSPTLSQSQLNVEIPTVSLEDNQKDIFTLSKEHNDLANKTIEVGDTETGSTIEPVEGMANAKFDKEGNALPRGGRNQAKDLKDYMVNERGSDPVDVYEEIKDVPKDKLDQHKDELADDRETNTPLYQRKLARIKWEDGLDKELIKGLEQGGVSPDEYNRVRNNMDLISDETGKGDYTNQRGAVKSLAQDIQLYGGENKDKLLKDFAVEVSKVYGNAYNNNFDKVASDTPESKYLNNDEQLALQYIKDIAPDKAGQYDRLMIDPKTLKDNPDALKGYNHLKQTLEETGIGLQQNSVNEELNSLSKQAEENGGLSPDQLQMATDLQKKNEELSQKRNELDKKYPDRITDKVDDAVQEILGQRANFGGRFMGKVTQGVGHTVEGMWNLVSQPFMSDASNNLTELGIMGASIREEKDTHLTDKNKSIQDSELIIQPEIKSQIDAIKNDKNLSYEQKATKITSILKNNPDKFGRVSIQGGKFNFSPSAILNSVSDVTASLVPFIAMEAATGGIGGAGTAAKMFRTANAAFTTGFYDHQAEGIKEGKTGSDLYKYAVVSTLIDAMAIGGAQTASEIRALAGNKTSAAKMLASLSDKEIEAQLAKGVAKPIKVFGKNIEPFLTATKDRLATTPKMFAEGLKTGAKFELATTAANELKHQIYNTDIDRELNLKHSILGGATFGIIGAGLGQLGYKAPNELQRDFIVKFGEDPDSFHAINDKMKKDGEITQVEYDHRKTLIEKSAEAYKALPKANAKGKPLTEKEKGEYLYNTVIKNEGNSAKSNLPPKQAEKAEITAMAADHANDLILDPKTDKQLESRKGFLERKLELNQLGDENAIHLSDKELISVKGELQAVNDAIEHKKSFEKVEMQRREITPKPTELSTEAKPDVVGSEELANNADLMRDILDETKISKDANTLNFEERDNIHQGINDYETGKISGEELKKVFIDNNVPEEYLSRKMVENGMAKNLELPQSTTEPITISNENTQASTENTEPNSAEKTSVAEPVVSETTPEAGIGEEKVTGIKKSITEAIRAERGLPKVELPKMGTDISNLEAAKERVDSGKSNPLDIINRILEDKNGFKNHDESFDIQYYAHQLERHNEDLNKQLSEAETPEEKAAIVGQKMQLSDKVDALTEATRIAGNTAGKVLSSFAPVISLNTGQIFRENKAIIKEAYGGEVPKEVQAKLDALTKERDEAIAAKVKLEEELRQKMAQKGFEEIKKRAAKTARTKETAEQLKKEEQDLLQQLKDAGKADPTAPKRSGVALTDKHVVIIGKLALNYFKQGVNGLEAIINKIHDAVRDEISGITRKDIRDLLANYDPLTIEKEIERLNKKADLLENKLTPPSVDSKGKPTEKTDFGKQSKIERTFRNNTEWTKANQRVANAEHKMKIEKRKAFESQKNLYQRGLMWLGRLTRLSVLSGKAVLAKLASAAVIGGAIKRIPEQAIGAMYSGAFKGIAEKAPIEGYVNAKAEANFYKEFFNPKKFAQNSWQILKSGTTDLGKRLGGAEYEHVPVLYLPTDLHQIIKDPLKRGAYEASLRNGLVWAEKQGLDINDPLVINSLENAAYKRAQYEIFQESNKLSRWFVSQKASLEKKGNAGATVKFLVDFLIPVSTVPANLVRRAATTSPVGLVRGGAKVVEAYRKGIENLSTEEAESIMKQLKQGTLGTALWLAGWFGYQSFGGLYSQFNPNKKREEGDKVSDVMIVNGEEIPKPVQHALPLEVIQVAATARRIYENYRKNKNASTPEALLNAGLGSIGALGEQIPVIETPIHAALATQDPQELDKFKEDIDRRIVPQIIREETDKTKGSNDLKYLDDHQLKIVDIHKESLQPVNSKGERVFVTPELFKKVTDVREEKIKKEIADARKNGFVIWETGEKIPADKITKPQLRSWLMGVSTKAKNEAINEVFGEQPEKEDKPKVETYQ
ncbi:MAG: hypothetical protein V4538_15285 [Bacteroidota bacterium]